MDYPAAWVAKEGERPHIVQTFVPDRNIPTHIVSIVVAGALPSIPSDGSADEEAARTLCEEETVRAMTPSSTVFLGTSGTTVEGRTACFIETRTETNRVGVDAVVRSSALMFVIRGVMVQVQGAAVATTTAEADEQMSAFRPLLQRIENSIVLPDRWQVPAAAAVARPAAVGNADVLSESDAERRARYEATGAKYGGIIGAILGVIVSWALSLCVPLAIRYRFRRAPTPRPEATRIAALNAVGVSVLSFVVMVATGTTRGGGSIVTGGLVTFFLGRWILTRGARAAAE